MIYLDNAATTPLCEAALEAYIRVNRECWGNPSSLHSYGLRAKAELDKARKTLARLIGANENEFYFTSGGSESDSMALLGTAGRFKKGRILVSELEHPAVAQPLKQLAEAGFEVLTLPWGGSPEAFLDGVRAAANSDTILASFMLVHNETGLLLPVEEAARIVKKASARAVVHCDAAQAFCKIELNVNKLGVDLLSVSSHKIHGPVGIGGLFVKNGVRLKAMILGGGQENGLRSGTEAVALASGFAAAAEDWKAHKEERTAEAQNFARLLSENLSGTGIHLNLSQYYRSPFILSISVPPIPSEVLLRILEGEGILVSAGSACSKNKKEKTLTSLLPKADAESVIRVSLGRENRAEEAVVLAEALKKASSGFGRYFANVNKK